MDHLNTVEPGCVGTIVGGYVFMLLKVARCFYRVKLGRYRRGKPASNDIDIVFTHGNAVSAKGLCARLVERLRSAGLVTHVMREYRPQRSWFSFPLRRA
jgi:DNA polymerase IV